MDIAVHCNRINVHIPVLKDFFKLTEKDFTDVSYVYVYLFPEVVERIERELVPLMQPGTKIIANSFPLKGHTPIQTFERANGQPVIYIYEI